MTKNEKKGILILVGVVLVVLVVIVFTMKSGNKAKDTQVSTINPPANVNSEKYTTNVNKGTKINNSNEFNKIKKYNNIEISNIQYTYEAGRSVLLADIKNTGSTQHNEEIVKVTILDENNQAIDVLIPTIPNLKAGETKQWNIIITGKDSVNAKDFKIEAK